MRLFTVLGDYYTLLDAKNYPQFYMVNGNTPGGNYWGIII